MSFISEIGSLILKKIKIYFKIFSFHWSKPDQLNQFSCTQENMCEEEIQENEIDLDSCYYPHSNLKVLLITLVIA
jgi:hypothetical protein